LYADFYSADIIVASPLGLRVIVGAEGEEDRNFDFLASVEILVLDQADIFLMQVECNTSFVSL
jgi:U3 small nucleolar RNA-associated protein 25